MNHLPLSPDQEAWMNTQAEKHGLKIGFDLRTTNKSVNPCLAVFGAGPVGQICKTCIHLRRRRMGKTYLKCDLRHETRGPATDHKATWPACARFELNTKN